MPKAVKGLFLGGLQGPEMVGPMVGLSSLVWPTWQQPASEDLLATVDEVAVKHEQSLYVDPVGADQTMLPRDNIESPTPRTTPAATPATRLLMAGAIAYL